MADFSLGSSGTGRLECWINWNSSSQTSFHYKLQAEIRNGANNTVGDANWNGNLSGYGNASGNWTYNTNGWRTLREFDVVINKDANGYLTVNAYGYISGANSPYVGAGSTNFDVSPARIGEAPTISSITADSVTSTSVRLGGELSSVGRGTSATWTMYYRVSGAASWTSAGAQADVGGFNYWTVSGLQPGKTYQYYATCANNNGDTATSGVQTFATKPIPSIAVLLMGLL